MPIIWHAMRQCARPVYLRPRHVLPRPASGRGRNVLGRVRHAADAARGACARGGRSGGAATAVAALASGSSLSLRTARAAIALSYLSHPLPTLPPACLLLLPLSRRCTAVRARSATMCPTACTGTRWQRGRRPRRVLCAACAPFLRTSWARAGCRRQRPATRATSTPSARRAAARRCWAYARG